MKKFLPIIIIMLILILNYLNIYQPFMANACKAIPIYFIFAIILIILAFLGISFCMNTTEENKALKNLDDCIKECGKNKFLNNTISLIFVLLFILYCFIWHLALYTLLKTLFWLFISWGKGLIKEKEGLYDFERKIKKF